MILTPFKGKFYNYVCVLYTQKINDGEREVQSETRSEDSKAKAYPPGIQKLATIWKMDQS